MPLAQALVALRVVDPVQVRQHANMPEETPSHQVEQKLRFAPENEDTGEYQQGDDQVEHEHDIEQDAHVVMHGITDAEGEQAQQEKDGDGPLEQVLADEGVGKQE